jgi:GxxExxY protein
MKNRVFMKPTPHPLSKEIVGLAMKVHRGLGCGFLESVYRNALAIELRSKGFSFEIHPTLSVMYEGIEVGVFQADLIVNREIIVELKAVDLLTSVHSAQLVNYLAAAKIDHGLLLNFGVSSLEFRTKNRIYSGLPQAPNLQD